MEWAFVLDTAFYPTPRSLGLLFNVVRPSYLGDIWYLSVCGIAPHLIQNYYWHIQGVDASQLPKVWSANTYRHSLISKVVGVPVCEKAAYFFLSLLPYIYIIARILEFFKLFFNKPRQVTICISTLGDGCPFRPLGLNMYVSYVFCGGSHMSRHIVCVCRNIYDRP